LFPNVPEKYKWHGRSIKDHRRVIREFYDFRPASLADEDELRGWLGNEILPEAYRPHYLEELVYGRLGIF